MSDITVPRGALVGAAVLIGLTMTAITTARHYDVGRLTVQTAQSRDQRMLIFEPLPNGEMMVLSEQREPLAHLVIEGDTFAMTAVRALAMQRNDRELADEFHLLLQRDNDGHLELADPDTGRTVKLQGFGQASALAFARYLDAAKSQPAPG
tara:strand:- start:203 stop:655 length:453 start_codon:yes stop_codon:yes gene_type:complete